MPLIQTEEQLSRPRVRHPPADTEGHGLPGYCRVGAGQGREGGYSGRLHACCAHWEAPRHPCITCTLTGLPAEPDACGEVPAAGVNPGRDTSNAHVCPP